MIVNIFQNKKIILISLTGMVIILGVFFGYFLFKNYKISELQKQGAVGEYVLKDFSKQEILPILKNQDNYKLTDSLNNGISIQYANLTEEQKKDQESKPKNEFNIEFPKNYTEPINIKLDEERAIQITDKNGDKFTDKLITEEIPLFVNNELRIKNQEENQESREENLDREENGERNDTEQEEGHKNLDNEEGEIDRPLNPAENNLEKLNSETENTTQKTSYLKYQDQENRKSIYYAYQKNNQERKLKHWTIYSNPDKNKTEEKESYQISNAKIKLNDKGEVEVFYFGDKELQNEQVKAEVDHSLMERAQKTLQKELGEDILNTDNHRPDFIIPTPYYLNKEGKKIDLKWEVDQEENVVTVKFSPPKDEYPIALDPTLQFSAPGQDNSGDVITSNNVEDGGYFGSFFASGDFNNDGKTDLAVGADDYLTGTGRVYIFYNDSYIPGAAAMADIIITGEGINGGFGNVIASGDFNNDGSVDLAIGAYGYLSSTGRAYIFYNDGSIPTTAATADVIITGGAAYNYFGFSLIGGDFNGDGAVDLAVGAYGYSSNTGRAYIFYNDGSIPTTAATADVIITGGGSGNYFGFSLIDGDFDTSGTVDLAVGAYGYSSNTGRAYIFYNDGSIPTTAATADVIITGETTSNYFGFHMTSGDLDASGTVDLAVGAYGYTTSTGRAYIFYNDGSIPTTAMTADVTITGEATVNYFGRFLTKGDFNSDGKTDLAVGAYGYSSSTGRVYIFYNDGSIPTTAATADVIITGESGANSHFGRYIESGDFDADGDTDLVVGAYNHASSNGRIYIFYNDGGYPSLAVNADKIISGGADTEQFGSIMTSGDFNADGKVDLAVSSKGYAADIGKISIFYNDGSYDTSANGADLTIVGEDAYNYFGGSILSTDFNNDNKTDLIIGAYGYLNNTGRVYIFYNDGSIPTSAANADLIITGEANSSFGYSVMGGDLDGDGKTDLAVGATGYSTNTGRAYIFYNDGSIPTTAATADVTITGEATNNYFGSAMASGDFNADGKTDLAVGAYGYSSSTGRAYIFYNDGSIPTTAATADIKITGQGSLSYFGYSLISGNFNFDNKIDLIIGAYNDSASAGRAYIFYNDGSIPTTAGTADVVITGENNVKYFGYSMISGDFNADGKTDLAVGAYSASSVLPYYYTGRAYIFYNDGTIPVIANTADVIITGEGANQYFGSAMTSGDFNADGKTDLAVGAYAYSSGRAYIFYSQNGQISIINTITDKNGKSGNFGYAMTSGDFNNDGRIDLAVGTLYSAYYLGRVYVFYNDGSISDTVGLADLIIVGEGSMDHFGMSMTSGDFNADGTTDLAVGAYDDDKAYIFYNDGTIPTTAATADVIITGSMYFGKALIGGDFNADGKTDLAIGSYSYAYIFYNDGTIPTTSSAADVAISGSAYVGSALASGDFNSDGRIDLAVGEYSYTTNTGRACVFYNDGTIPTTTATADVIITGESTNNYFGSSITSGDFNSDGRIDLAVGAYGYTSNTGRAYIFYNDGTIPTTAVTADVIITGETTNNYFGHSMTSGDFNNDETIDLAVGAYGYTSNTGRAYIFYNDGTIPTTAATADIVITGESTYSYFSSAMTNGDFNDDGKVDLAVGAHGYTSNTGRAYIFYNDGAIPTTAATADVVITGDETFSLFGTTLGKGDLNSDGKTDLLVGAKNFSSGAGCIYVFYGDNNLPTSTETADLRIAGEGDNNYFGSSITSGDFNSDGRIDLAVGAIGYASNAGRAYIFYNDGSIPTTAIGADVKIDGEALSKLGNSMVNGDFNADNKIDLAVGAYGYTSNIGRAYIFYNDGTIPTTAVTADVIITGQSTGNYFSEVMVSGDFNADGKTDLAVAMDSYGSGAGQICIFYNDGSIPTTAATADVRITGGTNNTFGTSLAGGDFNNDGKTDLVAGAYFIGKAYIFYNDGSYPTASSAADIIIDGYSPDFNYFGSVMASGDFNADGKIDLAVGTDTNSRRVFIFYNDGSIPSLVSGADIKISNQASGFGYALISGDFNADGKTDLGVGGYDTDEDLNFSIYTVDAPGTKPDYIQMNGSVQLNGSVLLQQ